MLTNDRMQSAQSDIVQILLERPFPLGETQNERCEDEARQDVERHLLGELDCRRVVR
jgi:hypothetical protein